jgi:hypothetical protein
MATPLIISSIFVLAVVALCILKPNAGRIFLGFFFLVMAFGVNGTFILTNPQGYVDYLSNSLLPLYRDLTAMTVALNPIPYGLLLMLFEIAVGVLILSKGRWVKYGLAGTMVFVIFLAPVSVMQIPWLGLLIGQAYLITKTFERSILEMVFKKKSPA